MKVSLNIVKQFTDIDLPLSDLITKINSQVGSIEEVTDLGDVYKDAVIVKVIACDKHPNADKLNVCLVDDGGVTQGVERNDDGLVQVVCGAPNVKADIFAVWLPPRSVVPSTYHESEPFILGARELRGIVSQGMLAAGDELGINSDHAGIVVLTDHDVLDANELKAGASFARAFGLDDTIIDIENKMFTHRPDLFGQLGVAREIAGIQHKAFVSPEWYLRSPRFNETDELPLTVFNEAGQNVPRFMTITVKDIEVKPSPLWLQCSLIAMGGKPINNIVDMTNYVMLLTAQPTHAYDYDKLRGSTLGARMAKSDEKAELLNGKTYQLDESDIVIVDGEGVVGLGGIMGGGNSEVSSNTRNIVLEVANFNMYTLRKSSMRHGLFTDALTRFNKGQSPFQNDFILHFLLESILKISGGNQASKVSDVGDYDSDCTFVHTSNDAFDDKLHEQSPHCITSKFINERLGLELTSQDITQLLSNVEFTVKEDESGIDVFKPFWRTDIEEPEDIVEEVGRLYGYDRLPRELPNRNVKPAIKNAKRELKQKIRESLSKAGANEVLTYSFIPGKLLDNVGVGRKGAFKVANALSPELEYYRFRPLPSLLEKVRPNIKSGHSEFALFEIGKGHDANLPNDEDGLPEELEYVELVYANKNDAEGAVFYKAKRIFDQLARDLGVHLVYKTNPFEESTNMYDPKRSAFVHSDSTNGNSGAFIGMIGEIDRTVASRLKLPKQCAALTIDLDSLLDAYSKAHGSYRPLSRYPSISQDISLKVAQETPYENVSEVIGTVIASLDSLEISVKPLAIYQASGDTTHKTITMRLTVTSYERTLTDSEVSEIVGLVSKRAAQTVDAQTV